MSMLFLLNISNLGQKFVDKFTELSEIGFSNECFRANFSRFSGANTKFCLLGGQL